MAEDLCGMQEALGPFPRTTKEWRRRGGKQEKARRKGERRKKKRPEVDSTVIPALERWRQEDQDFKASLSYIMSLKLAWATFRPKVAWEESSSRGIDSTSLGASPPAGAH